MVQKLQVKLCVLTFVLGATSLLVQAQGPLYAASGHQVAMANGSQNYSLLELLQALEKQFNVLFDYDAKSLKGKTTAISKGELDNMSLGETLSAVLPPLGLQYKKYSEHSYIIYSPKKGKGNATAKDSATGDAAPAQQAEVLATTSTETTYRRENVELVISGTVVDELNTPMPGVNVVLKGTTVGTSTDVNGKYVLTIPDATGVLVFSFIGYTTHEEEIGTRTTIDYAMQPDVSTLGEVVVIGYGTVKKRDLTGSVASVKSDVIKLTPTHNAVESMQGRVAGMDIVRSSGTPGAGTNVVIRGNKSIATTRDKQVDRSAPLYIIDGYQQPIGSGIGDLNTNDIESIEVLKDASATAIYGAMGANGVVIITTKRGSEGRTKVSYNAYYGKNIYDFPKSRTGEDYLNLRREAFRTVGEWNSTADDNNIFPDTNERSMWQAGQWVDWFDLIVHDGDMQSHTISVSGGNEKTKVFTSAGYFKENGMLLNNDYTRYNVRFNLDQTVSKWAKIGLSSQLTYGIQNGRKDPLSQAIAMGPLGVPYDANGVIANFPTPDVSRISPIIDEKNDYMYRDNTIKNNIMTNAYVELTPLKGLTFRSNFGTNLTFSRQGQYQDKESLSRVGPKTNWAQTTNTFARFMNWDNVLTYNKKIGEHNITVTGITSYLHSDEDRTIANGTGQANASQLYYALDGASAWGAASPYTGWKNLAFAGRVNYTFKGKYLFSASGRYDGASRLSPGHNWAFFPSVAAGWNIIDEAFLADVEKLSNLKFRASYGTSGNYNIDVYGTQSGLTAYKNLAFGEVPAPYYRFKTTIGNSELGWETSATTNVGLDLGVFDDRITASVDVYKTVTTDMLLRRELPQSSGASGPAGPGGVFQNIGESENKGIEIAVTTQNTKNDNFQWNTTFTFSHNKETITGLVDGKDMIVDEENSYLIGRPIFSFYTFKKLGVWQSDEADEAATYRPRNATTAPYVPGDLKVADLNGDHIISADSDRMYVGSVVPQWIGGIQNNFSYKGFDLGIFIFARYGQTIEAEFLGRYNPSGTGNGPALVNYWTPENPTNDYPRPKKNETLNNYPGYTGYQALSYVDGSFIKLKNVTLGYTLPASLTDRASISKLRFYVTANNLFVANRNHLIKNYDPERGGQESSPLAKTFVFGINMDF